MLCKYQNAAGLFRAAGCIDSCFCKILLILRSLRANIEKQKFMVKCSLHSAVGVFGWIRKNCREGDTNKKSFHKQISVNCTRKIFVSLFPTPFEEMACT